MTKKIPRFITEQCVNGAHGFRMTKRRLVRQLARLLGDLRFGCYYMPTGNREVKKIDRALENMREALSVKNWGR